MHSDPTGEDGAARRWLTDARTQADQRSASTISIVVFGILSIVFLLTVPAAGNLRQNIDTLAVAMPAQVIAYEGSLNVRGFAPEVESQVRWLVPVDDALYSDRAPGLIAITVPSYLMHRLVWERPTLALAPSSVTSALVTALACGIMAYALAKRFSPVSGFAAAMVLGLATSTWSMSSAALWPHGPGQLWLSVAVLASLQQRKALLGAAAFMNVVSRPITAVAHIGTSLHEVLSRRGFTAAAVRTLAIGSAALVLALYHQLVFDQGTIAHEDAEFVANSSRLTTGTYLWRVGGALLDPTHGVLFLSPFVALLLFGMRKSWSSAPSWVRSAAAGGGLYFVSHYVFNRYNPGLTFNYRYPLESLLLLTPLGLHIYTVWIQHRPNRVRLFWVLVFLSVGVQLVAVSGLGLAIGRSFDALVDLPNP